MRAEINEIDNRKSIEKNQQNQSWFFEKINKTDIQIKTKCCTTTLLLERAKSRTLAKPNADENAKWYSHFGRQFGIFLQN